MPMHTIDQLRAFTHEQLVELVLELEAQEPKLPCTSKPATDGCGDLGGARSGHAPDETPPRAPATGMNGLFDTPSPARPQLERNLSLVPTNVDAAARLRTELTEVVEGIVLGRQSSIDVEGARAWQQLIHSNFFLPSLHDRDPLFEKFVHSMLTARKYEDGLVNDLVLNWAIDDLGSEHQLHVIRTDSDGNCLLHAALLGMWGISDTQVVGTSGLSSLRAAMSRVFQDPKLVAPLRNRWTLQLARDNAWEQERASQDSGSASRKPASGPLNVEVSDSQMSREWDEMVEIASRPNEFLDSIHVMALAHALRRPVIVLASSTQDDIFGQPLAPIFFRGIYLPLERSPAQCCRQPLLLCFRDAHFMPLVPKTSADSQSPVKVPLADGAGLELPFRFALAEELTRQWELAEQYMDLDMQALKAGNKYKLALLHRSSSHPLVDVMVGEYVEHASKLFEAERQEEAFTANAKRNCDASNVDFKRQKTSGDVPLREIGAGGEATIPDQDVRVEGTYEVRLPRGARPGNRSFLAMPKGCTDRQEIEFTVPDRCSENDIVSLKAKFYIKAHCIRAVMEVTQTSREQTLVFLTQSRGDTEIATQLYFDSLDAD